MSTCSIYKITSPSNKIYIGQTIDFERRLSEYRNLECKNQLKLYNSLIKYGFENHIFEILEICSIEDANFRERYYQEFFDVLNKNGLNLKYQSTADKKCVHSEETKQKISKITKGKKRSDETKLKMSKAKSGQNNPMFNKPVNKGRKLSEELKLKLSINSKGKNRKKVINLETQEIYNCVLDAFNSQTKVKTMNTFKGILSGHQINKTPFIYLDKTTAINGKIYLTGTYLYE
jgi:group I intron endonuclease